MTRDLLVKKTGEVIGSVTLVGDRATFAGEADQLMKLPRSLHGDAEIARQILADGWFSESIGFGDPHE